MKFKMSQLHRIAYLATVALLFAVGNWGLACLTFMLAGYPCLTRLGVTGSALTYPGGVGMDVSTAPATGTATWQMIPQYMRGIKNGLQRRKYLLNRFGQKPAIPLVGGTHFELRMLTGGIIGAGWNSGSGALQRPGSSTGIVPKSNPSALYHVLQFDRNTIEKAQTVPQVFEASMELEMRKAEMDGGKLLNQALYGTRKGVLGVVSGAPAAGVITLGTSADLVPTGVSGDRTKFFHVGLPLAAVKTDLTVRQNGMLVTAVNRAANTITVTLAGTLDGAAGAGDTADTDMLVIGHLDGAGTSYGQAITGLHSWLGSAVNNVWGLDRSQAANALWKPIIISPTEGEALEATLRRAKSTAFKYGGDEGGRLDNSRAEGFVWLTSPEGYDKYGAALLGTRQYFVPTSESQGVQGGTVVLPGGFVAIWADGVPMVQDSDCPVGCYNGLWLDQDWDIYSENGGVGYRPVMLPSGGLLQKIPLFPLYVIELVAEFELGCSQPNRQVQVQSVTMPVY